MPLDTVRMGGVLAGMTDDKKLDAIADIVARLEERMANNNRRLDEVMELLRNFDERYAGRAEFAGNRRMIIVSMVFSIFAFGLSLLNGTLVVVLAIELFRFIP